eukprot:1156787-Prorocentrum_minimum.AAC.1
MQRRSEGTKWIRSTRGQLKSTKGGPEGVRRGSRTNKMISNPFGRVAMAPSARSTAGSVQALRVYGFRSPGVRVLRVCGFGSPMCGFGSPGVRVLRVCGFGSPGVRVLR